MGSAPRSALTLAEQRPPGVAELVGYDLGSRAVEYSESDAILYALGVGASGKQLELVYERDLRVLPTFALPLALWAVEEAGAIGAYDPMKTLHVGQALTMHRPLPSVGRFECEARIAAVWDKGSAALLEIEVSAEPFDATYVIFVPGAGGFGGERGESSSIARADEPDLRVEATTSTNQAALYRLTGDRHPLHVDPQVAVAAGLARPILHGLCTLGTAARSVAEAIGRSPSELSKLHARFAASVYPGERLQLELWRTPDGAGFEAAVGERRVLSAGEATFTGGLA